MNSSEKRLQSCSRPLMLRGWLTVLFCTTLTTSFCHAQSLKEFGDHLVKVKVTDGKEMFGQPLSWDGSWMKLLRRTGQISTVKVVSKNQLVDTHKTFAGYTTSQMKKALQKEFGSKYEVTASSDFLVVHPVGKFETFGKPYTEIGDNFRRYFQSRGVKLSRPVTPMIAVVLNTRNEFDRMIAGHKNLNSKNFGYYWSVSNRSFAYDRSDDTKEAFTTQAIAHEATHQCAYNYGIHNRLHKPPTWAVEGLACMFEAPAFSDRQKRSKADRVSTGRLRSLRRHLETGKVNNKLSEVLSSDNLFRTNSNLAYAYSWGLTLFLAETRPKDYVKFLQKDASRNLSPKAGRDRLAIFAEVFGNDTRRLEADMLEFIAELE